MAPSRTKASANQSQRELRVTDVAVLGVGRLLVVDQLPEPLEDLRADQAGENATHDTDREEQALHRVTGTSDSAGVCSGASVWS